MLPSFHIVLRNEITDIDALGSLSILLLVPEQLFDLELELVNHFGLFLREPHSVKLPLLEFDLDLFFSPESLGDGY